MDAIGLAPRPLPPGDLTSNPATTKGELEATYRRRTRLSIPLGLRHEGLIECFLSLWCLSKCFVRFFTILTFLRGCTIFHRPCGVRAAAQGSSGGRCWKMSPA